MKRYFWSYVSNDREVVFHPANNREDAEANKERMKHSTLVQCGEARVGVSIRKATRVGIREWAEKNYPAKKVTILECD